MADAVKGSADRTGNQPRMRSLHRAPRPARRMPATVVAPCSGLRYCLACPLTCTPDPIIEAIEALPKRAADERISLWRRRVPVRRPVAAASRHAAAVCDRRVPAWRLLAGPAQPRLCGELLHRPVRRTASRSGARSTGASATTEVASREPSPMLPTPSISPRALRQPTFPLDLSRRGAARPFRRRPSGVVVRRSPSHSTGKPARPAGAELPPPASSRWPA